MWYPVYNTNYLITYQGDNDIILVGDLGTIQKKKKLGPKEELRTSRPRTTLVRPMRIKRKVLDI